MKKFTKILILPIITIIMLGGFASVALAQPIPPLDVHFQQNPLFSEANFLPGSAVTRTVEVFNNSGASQNIIVEAINAVDTGGLGDKLDLVIKGGGIILYNNKLSTFLRAGEVPLSTLANSANATYSFGVTFASDADNNTQNATLGFDLCVGFSGGTRNCGDTIVGGEGDTGSDAGNTGNGSNGGTVSGTGGGGSGTQHLIIFNERATSINAVAGSAVIIWDTNLLATSQVIYGPKINPTYSFDINNLPKFGYPSITTEDATKVIKHSVFIPNLTPGETYVYRVISRASPPTISYEHEFTVPISSGTESVITVGIGTTEPGAESAGSAGGVLGASSENNEDTPPVGEIAGAFDAKNLASVFSSGWSGIFSKCSLIAILILLIGYLIWKFILRPRYERRGLSEEEIKRKFYAFFGLFSALAIVIAFVINQYCPIPIFLIALLISSGFYTYHIVK